VSAIGFTHKMPTIVAIMMISMISNSFCTASLLMRNAICPWLDHCHVPAFAALIPVKARAWFLWE
jgi:hypothetical protein